jgi:hypothetical protein
MPPQSATLRVPSCRYPADANQGERATSSSDSLGVPVRVFPIVVRSVGRVQTLGVGRKMIVHWLSCGEKALNRRTVDRRCALPRRGAHHDAPADRPPELDVPPIASANNFQAAGALSHRPIVTSRRPTPSVDFKETFSQLDQQLGNQRHRASNISPEIIQRFQVAGGLGFEPRLTESEVNRSLAHPIAFVDTSSQFRCLMCRLLCAMDRVDLDKRQCFLVVARRE